MTEKIYMVGWVGGWMGYSFRKYSHFVALKEEIIAMAHIGLELGGDNFFTRESLFAVITS